MNRSLVVGALVLGLLFLALAVYYWLTPASALPPFLPGYVPGVDKIHYTHGLASLILGAGILAYAWFQSGKKSASKE